MRGLTSPHRNGARGSDGARTPQSENLNLYNLQPPAPGEFPPQKFAPLQSECPVPLPSGGISKDDDSLANLLLAWYYSGYYTGRYQALQEHGDGAIPGKSNV